MHSDPTSDGPQRKYADVTVDSEDGPAFIIYDTQNQEAWVQSTQWIDEFE